jgi:drug/metabolite transporter (DMT)-like permease
VLDTSANGLYLLATHTGLMSIVSVVVAMYPVATVFLAMTLDHERLHKSQVVGLLLALISLALVSL